MTDAPLAALCGKGRTFCLDSRRTPLLYWLYRRESSMRYPWFDLNLSRHTAAGIVIGLVLAALAKAWLQS